MGAVASALTACVYRPASYTELEELRCEVARLEKEMMKRGGNFKCGSDTCWI